MKEEGKKEGGGPWLEPNPVPRAVLYTHVRNLLRPGLLRSLPPDDHHAPRLHHHNEIRPNWSPKTN